MKYRNNQYPYSSYALYLFIFFFGGWALIRGWALRKYFLGVGTYSRLGAYKLFLPSGWALIRGGPYSRKLVLRYKLFQMSQNSVSMLTSDWLKVRLVTLEIVYI